MKRLSNQGYWNGLYQKSSDEAAKSQGLVGWLKQATSNYPNFLLWEKIFPHYFAGKAGHTLLEVGCAPGNYLTAFAARFGLDVYGVEYAPAGVQTTRERFLKEGLDPQHVIEADFFDDTFLAAHENEFDFVYSRGFIEHFDDPSAVVARHARLLKKDGLLIILIPNLHGLNKILAKYLNPESYAMHNTNIMQHDSFAALFPTEQYERKVLGLMGGFSFGLFNANTAAKQRLLSVLNIFQRPFDFVWRLCSPLIRIETPFTSPYLLAIVRKK